MNNLLKVAGIALAMGATACGGETAANGGTDIGPVEADTSRNWVEVVAKTEEGGFRMGNPDAPINIVEFGSLTCSACAAFSEQSFEPLIENYVSQGLVSFEMRNFVRDPLDLSAALLTRCNGAEPFFQLNERFFANFNDMMSSIQNGDQNRLQAVSNAAGMQSGEAFVVYAQEAGLVDLAGSAGIPEQRARECLTDSAAVQELEQMRNAALQQHNVQATPTFLINGEVVQNVYNWASLEARLQELVE